MGILGATQPSASATAVPDSRKRPFYATLWVQVLMGMAAGIALGYLRPATAVAMKPLGDAFIKLITMVITVIIFCTVVSGIAGMQDSSEVADFKRPALGGPRRDARSFSNCRRIAGPFKV